jgi:SAM-dependent methyltransferase
MDQAAATVYEEFFVPALFAEWPAHVLDAAGVRSGDRVLDLACGTGVLARAADQRVKPTGTVVGIDRSPGMLAVAVKAAPAVEMRHGVAESLPFADGSFDVVVSHFGLMFFEDRVAALREMRRVLRVRRRFAVAVWAELEKSPGYAALVGLIQRLFGTAAADALRAPFCLGDAQELAKTFLRAIIPSPRIDTHEGLARFPSIREWIYTEVKGWSPLGDMLDDEAFERLAAAAEEELSRFVVPGRSGVAFPISAHIVSGR